MRSIKIHESICWIDSFLPKGRSCVRTVGLERLEVRSLGSGAAGRVPTCAVSAKGYKNNSQFQQVFSTAHLDLIDLILLHYYTIHTLACFNHDSASGCS